jgi:hypothetical protein
MKLYTRALIALLILSLIWIYTIVDLTYYTLFQEQQTIFNTLDYSTQYRVVYILGTFLVVSYLTLIFSKRKDNFF